MNVGVPVLVNGSLYTLGRKSGEAKLVFLLAKQTWFYFAAVQCSATDKA